MSTRTCPCSSSTSPCAPAQPRAPSPATRCRASTHGPAPRLEEGHLPDKRNSDGDALDEEQRVLLVILSRARHGVIATRSSTQDGRFGLYPATPSRWWDALAQSATLSRQALEQHMSETYPPAST
jgi:hypothetical protein